MTRTKPWSRYTHEAPRRPIANKRSIAEPGGQAVAGQFAMLRLFVAIELDQALLDALAGLQAQMKAIAPSLRYVRPEGVHCTLKFLGDTDSSRLPAIQRALATVDEVPAPRELRLGRAGFFSGRDGPRVAWCGVEGDLDGVVGLATAVDQALVRLGFPAEEGRYTPHLTLARFPEAMPAADRKDAAARFRELDVAPATMRPSAFSLMASHRQTGGSVYAALARYELPPGR